MSGPAINVQRDGFWIEPKTADELSWPTATAVTAATYKANAKTAVHVDKAQAFARSDMTLSADQIELIGIYMTPPVGDNVPFRVKASMGQLIGGAAAHTQCIVVGYGPASLTGSDDEIDEPYIIPFLHGVGFDELVIVPALDSGDGNYGNPLFFGVGFLAGSAQAGIWTTACISVQNLGVKPPTMQNAVS